MGGAKLVGVVKYKNIYYFQYFGKGLRRMDVNLKVIM